MVKKAKKCTQPTGTVQKPKKPALDISTEPEMTRLKELAAQMNEVERARTIEYLKQEDTQTGHRPVQ